MDQVRCCHCGQDIPVNQINGEKVPDKWGLVLEFISPCCGEKVKSYVF